MIHNGFPVELTEEIVEGGWYDCRPWRFRLAMKEQQECARASAVKGGLMVCKMKPSNTVESVFNYNASQLSSKLVAIVADTMQK